MLNIFKSMKVEVMRGFNTRGIIKVSARINYVKCIRTCTTNDIGCPRYFPKNDIN